MTGKLCTFSAFEFWRLRTNSRTARRQFSTGVDSVPGFSKNHTVTNAIFVDADCSASERSPARRESLTFVNRRCAYSDGVQYGDESGRNRQIFTEHSVKVEQFLSPLTIGKCNFIYSECVKVFFVRICCVFYGSQGQTQSVFSVSCETSSRQRQI